MNNDILKMDNIKDYIPKSDFEIKINWEIKIRCKKSILVRYFKYFEGLYNNCDLEEYTKDNSIIPNLYSFDKAKMIENIIKIVCIEDDIKETNIGDLLNIDSGYIFNNKDINKIFSQKINLLIDILDFFIASDKVKNAFYSKLSNNIDKINEIKEYIKFNKNIIIPFIVYISNYLDKTYTLFDDYSGYECSYIGLTRNYVGPGRYFEDNNMVKPIYDFLSIIIYWKKHLLDYYNILDEIKKMIISLQITGYLFDKKYEDYYLKHKDIIPYEIMKFK